MISVSAQHDITDGNVSSTTLATIPNGGIPIIVGLLATSPGTDLTATVDLTVETPIGDFIFSETLSPGRIVPITIPLIFDPAGALGYSASVTGTDGSYQIFLAVKD